MGVGSRFRVEIDQMASRLRENDSRLGVFNLRLSRPIGLLPFLFPFRRRIPAPSGAGSLLGQREERKGWQTRCAYYQTGLPPVQDRWGARGIQGNQLRNGDVYARKREIKPECDKLNTPLPTSSASTTPSALMATHYSLSVPLVLGTLVMRGSGSTAIRSARAGALKIASLM